MTDTDQTTLTDDQLRRMVAEITQAAGNHRITQPELEAAHDALRDLAVSALLWRLWTEGRAAVGWDALMQDLTWRRTDDADNDRPKTGA